MKNLLRILVMSGVLVALSLAPAAVRGQSGSPPVSGAGVLTDSTESTAEGGNLSAAFAYRGALARNGSPYTGVCQFQFALWDAAAGGSLVAEPVGLPDVSVSAGVYDVQLDFGADAFRQARWLETTLQCAGDAGPTTLPRQALLAVPYAAYALGVDAANITGLSAGTGLTYSAGQFSIEPGAIPNDRLAHPGLTVNPGAGLTGGGAVELGGMTTLAIDTSALQARVSGTCAVGSYIIAVHADGAVTCAAPAALDPVLFGGAYTLTGGPGTSQ